VAPRPRPRKKPRPRDAQATRALLLHTAGLAFVELGFDGARVDDVAARSGVNKRMIYAYFGDKDGLYRAVLEAHLAKAAVLARTPPAEASARAAVEGFVRRFFAFSVAHEDFARLLSWEALSSERRGLEILVERLGALARPLHELLRRGVAQGEFRKDLDPHHFAAALTALLVGFQVHRSFLEALWKRDLGTAAAQAWVVDGMVKLMLEGIAARGG
jgi:TetR/AcrR family transcriptional regulator